MLHTQAEMLPTTSVTCVGYVIGSTKIHHSSLNQGVASVSLLSLIPARYHQRCMLWFWFCTFINCWVATSWVGTHKKELDYGLLHRVGQITLIVPFFVLFCLKELQSLLCLCSVRVITIIGHCSLFMSSGWADSTGSSSLRRRGDKMLVASAVTS